MILKNGIFYTMDENRSIAEAVKIKDNKIINVGKNEDILATLEEGEEVIDLEGKAVVPGFNDSHIHLVSYGDMLTQADLVGTTSVEDLIERMKEYIATNNIKEGQWVQGRGWNQDYFTGDKVFPTIHDLDKISKDIPIIVSRACLHVVAVNSKALELLNITGDTPQVDGGQFDIDSNGDPTGVFRERATGMAYALTESASFEDLKAMMVEAAKALNKHGITSVGADDFGTLPSNRYEDLFKAYKELIEEDKLNLRINKQCRIADLDILNGFFQKGYKTGWGDERFKIGPIKIFMDGSLGARTAALNEPYSDDPSTSGILTMDKEKLETIVEMAHSNDTNVAIHAIGDRPMYMGFEAIEKSLGKKPNKDHRHGIVHCQITDEYLLNKFRDVNVVAHVQPIFIDYDWHIAGDRVGEERMKTSYNWKTMVDMGVNLALGSDAPVDNESVLIGIYEAVTRKDLKGNPEGGWNIEQALSVDEAVYGYTMGSAYATFEEDIKGSIEVGKLADLTVLSEDIFNIQEDKIKLADVAMTIFNGKVVHSS